MKDDNIAGFSISANGGLSSVPGSPFAEGEIFGPESIALDPIGRFAYVLNVNNNGPGTLSTYVMGLDGGLRLLSDLPVIGLFPQQVTVDPSGRYVYVASRGNRSISGYNINSDGTLTPGFALSNWEWTGIYCHYPFSPWFRR